MRIWPLAVLLAACSHGEAPAKYVPPELPQDSCDSNSYQLYLGGPMSALDGLVIPEPKRIVPYGVTVSKQYDPIRLNFDLDAAGNISRVWCG